MAGEPRELWIIPKADHGEGYKVYSEEYRRKIIEFFKNYL
ncbi:MAG: alpha/beta hydrolase [Candidatus Omnitrophota bacterium]